MKHVKIIAAALIGAGILSAITLPGALAQASSSGESQAPANEIPAIEAPQENGDLGKAQAGAGNARGETAGRAGSCHGRGRGHGHGAKPAEAAEPVGAIGKDAAKAAALADAGLTAEQVQKLRSRVSDKDGTTVYKVKFTYENQSYSYRIDPVSGAVLDKTVSEVTNEGGHRHGRPQNSGAMQGSVGEAAPNAAAEAAPAI